ncbi:hypothetical protein V6B14_23320 (plasmid) [Sporosarcina psychrophila]|uniref:hypothetical protein n=1 Tax=Sporosarcina psychrophila TaxID=1476 RepID=UPI0030D2AF40
MQILAKFENGERVTVERYEQDKKVGTRRLYINDYIVSLMTELPISDIIQHIIVERNYDYKEYIKSLEDTEELSDFMVQTMQHADRFYLGKNKQYQLFLKYALEKVDLLQLHGEVVENLFVSLIDQVKGLPNEPIYVQLLDELLKRVITIDTKKEVIGRVFPILIKMASDVNSKQLREWFELAIPHIDPLWLIEALGRLKDAEEMKIAELEIPKNCVLAQVTTKRHIYVLEIPKSRFRVKFHNLAYEDVGHPRLACILHVQNKQVTKMKLVAVPDVGDISLETPIYHYPYSNVFDNGVVCWNGYKDEIINSGKDLATMPLIFLSGTNNTHLQSNVRELFEHYSGQDFPAEQLRPFGMTIKQIM